MSPATASILGSTSPEALTIYFAGGLFDHKALVGNQILATYIETMSKNRYKCVLPQNVELPTHRAAGIRNADLRLVMACDLAIFNFDGTELDSGTVVEKMFAKFLDIPCVTVRSDFRNGGDGLGDKEADPWNLMCSFYPRTRKIKFNSMAVYAKESAKGGTQEGIRDRIYTRIAKEIVKNLDVVAKEKPILKGDPNDIYYWALRFPGTGLLEETPTDFVHEVLKRKRRLGLI